MSEDQTAAEALAPLTEGRPSSFPNPAAAQLGPPEPGIGAVDHRYDPVSEEIIRPTPRPEGSEEYLQERAQERANHQLEALTAHYGNIEDVQEALELTNYTLDRLGISEETAKQYISDHGTDAIIEAHNLAEALLEVGDMTPAEARRAKKDFIGTPGNVEKLDKSPKLRRWWTGVVLLAAQK